MTITYFPDFTPLTLSPSDIIDLSPESIARLESSPNHPHQVIYAGLSRYDRGSDVYVHLTYWFTDCSFESSVYGPFHSYTATWDMLGKFISDEGYSKVGYPVILIPAYTSDPKKRNRFLPREMTTVNHAYEEIQIRYTPDGSRVDVRFLRAKGDIPAEKAVIFESFDTLRRSLFFTLVSSGMSVYNLLKTPHARIIILRSPKTF